MGASCCHFETIKTVVLARIAPRPTVCYGIHRRVRPEPRIVRSKQGLELFVHKQPPVNVLAVWGGKRLYMMVVSVSFPYFIIQFEIGRLYTL